MEIQGDLFSGATLRDIGIKKAINNADNRYDNWSSIAFDFLCEYIRHNSIFMAENVRQSSRHIIPEPPSKRAWGGVIVKAVKKGLIKRKGYQNVSNSKAHCTPATLWERI